MTPDVVVIGGGLVGCASTLALADAGARVTIVREYRPGAASAAAAGLLAPSLDEARGELRSSLAVVARDRFPAYLDAITHRSGRRIALNRSGLLHVALTDEDAERIRPAVRSPGQWLTPIELRELEPALADSTGAALWPEDGSVDNVALLAALEWLVERHPAVALVESAAERIEAHTRGATVRTANGTVLSTASVVLCAGAWSGSIDGAPLARAVEPVRGQLIELADAGLRHAVFAAHSYLVPRPGCTVAGTTMEHVGFDPGTTDEAVTAMTAAARALCSALRDPPTRAWSGLRPLTPDLLPLIGRDPDRPTLVYACGHSRNGILLAPITAEIVTALIFEEPLTFAIDQFHPARFADRFTQ